MSGAAEGGVFAASDERYESIRGWLDGAAAAALQAAELEEQLGLRTRELTRQLFQDHLELRAHKEERIEPVVAADGVPRKAVETGHTRPLVTTFGEVEVTRMAYRRRGQANLYPADAGLNLPEEKASHGLRRLAAVEAARGSYEETVQAVERATGVRLGKRQAEELVARAAVDFDDFYATRKPEPAENPDQLLVLSCDGKGVPMRPDALRPATAKAAAKATPKLASRTSKGEKRGRKRLAEVGAVYDAKPVVRTPADIFPLTDEEKNTATDGPTATNKWLVASVADDAAEVITAIFDEATRRDPEHERHWVALVDGNNHQIDRINAEAASHGVDVAVLVDIVHAREYLWGAAWSFYPEADPAAEQWVHQQTQQLLRGKATQVAGAIRAKATKAGLSKTKRKGADTAAAYLTSKAPYMDYPRALAGGWPVATGVIEGACRYVVKDRMSLTGARWGLAGAETVLKLRAIRANDDWQQYWCYHLAQERRRIHHSRYLNGVIPRAA